MAVTEEYLRIIYETIGASYLKDLQTELNQTTAGHQILTQSFKDGAITADQYQAAMVPITLRVKEMQAEMSTFKDIIESVDVGINQLQMSGLKLQDSLRLEGIKMAEKDLKAFESGLQSTMIPLSSLQMSGLQLQDSMNKSAGGTLNADLAVKQFSGSLHALSLGRPMYAIGDLSNAMNTLAAGSTALAPYLTLISLGTVAVGSAAIAAYHHWDALKDKLSGGAISEEAARVKTLADETAKLAKEAEGLSDKLNKAKGPKEEEYEKYAKATTKPLLDDRERIAEEAALKGPHAAERSARGAYESEQQKLNQAMDDGDYISSARLAQVDQLKKDIEKAIKNDVLTARGLVEKAIVEGNEGAIKDLAQYTSGHVRDVLEAATKEGHDRAKAAEAAYVEIDNQEKLKEKQDIATLEMRQAQHTAQAKLLDLTIKNVTEAAHAEDTAHKHLATEANKHSKDTVKNLHDIQKNIDHDAKTLAHSLPNLAQHHERNVTGAPVTFIDRDGTMRMKAPGHDQAHVAPQPPVQPSAEEIEAPWLTVAKLPTSRVPSSRIPVQRGQGMNRKRAKKGAQRVKAFLHPPLVSPDLFRGGKGASFDTAPGNLAINRADAGGGMESLTDPFNTGEAMGSLGRSLQPGPNRTAGAGALGTALSQATGVAALSADTLRLVVGRQEYSEDTLSNRGGSMLGRSGMDSVAGY